MRCCLSKGSGIMQALKFNVYDEFSCTGPECGDSCCKHWRITLTKREYLDYKKLECSPELKAVIDSAFKREKADDDNAYALMKLREDGSCPFLGEDRLCMLQKEKGEEILTFVCSTFPRNWCQVGDDAIAFTLSPTCYHTVELLMKHPEGLALTEEKYVQDNKWINRNRGMGFMSSDDPTFPYIWSIKTAQLDILQNRDFSISERLLILGYYTQKVCDYLENSPEKIAQLGTMILDKELCENLARSLKPSQPEAQLIARSADMLFKLAERGNRVEPDGHLTELVNTIADSVGLTYLPNDDGTYECHFNPGKYAENLAVYRRIEEQRPYITENLLVSLAFGRFSGSGEELWADYFSLALMYSFLKTGAAAFLSEGWGDKELAIAINNIVKLIVNANITKNVTLRDFATRGMNSLSHIAFLIS